MHTLASSRCKLATAPSCARRSAACLRRSRNSFTSSRTSATRSLTFPSWEAYLAAVKQTPFFQFSWDPALESYFRADLRENPDRSIQSRARPEAIGAAIEGILIEDWPALLAKIQQPVLVFNAQGPYGPPGAPPFLPRDQALATVAALANGRYVAFTSQATNLVAHRVLRPADIPLVPEGARQIVEAITAFLQEGHDTIAR